jgi:hypothetical protein
MKSAAGHPLVRATLRDLRASVTRGFAITRRNLLRLHQRRLSNAGLSSTACQEQLLYLRTRYPKLAERRR